MMLLQLLYGWDKMAFGQAAGLHHEVKSMQPAHGRMTIPPTLAVHERKNVLA